MPDRAYRLSPMWMQRQSQKLHRWYDDHYPDRYFQESKMSGFDAYFVSDDVSFSVKTENASDLEYQGYEIAGLKDYAKEICSLNGISTDKLVQRNNYYYFSNTQTVSGAKYTYLHCMLKEGNNYWICEFVCKHRSYDSLEKSMLQWADSITFDQQ